MRQSEKYILTVKRKKKKALEMKKEEKVTEEKIKAFCCIYLTVPPNLICHANYQI